MSRTEPFRVDAIENIVTEDVLENAYGIPVEDSLHRRAGAPRRFRDHVRAAAEDEGAPMPMRFRGAACPLRGEGRMIAQGAPRTLREAGGSDARADVRRRRRCRSSGGCASPPVGPWRNCRTGARGRAFTFNGQHAVYGALDFGAHAGHAPLRGHARRRGLGAIARRGGPVGCARGCGQEGVRHCDCGRRARCRRSLACTQRGAGRGQRAVLPAECAGGARGARVWRHGAGRPVVSAPRRQRGAHRGGHAAAGVGRRLRFGRRGGHAASRRPAEPASGR